MEVGLFFMPKIERREFRWQKKKVRCNNANQHSGGGSRARKNHIGMYRMLTAELQHDKREKESSGKTGDQKVL